MRLLRDLYLLLLVCAHALLCFACIGLRWLANAVERPELRLAVYLKGLLSRKF